MAAGVVAGLLCWAVLAPRAGAEEIVPDGGWRSFGWFNAPNTFNIEGPFTFTEAKTVQLKVTDAFINGDRFAVYDSGTLVGTTSKPGTSGKANTSDPDVAFQDPAYSSGTFWLTAGQHSITIKTTEVADGWTHGVGFLRVDNVHNTPEPTSFLLAALGLAALVGWCALRRRRPPVAA
jgi:hypothetical protein